MYKTYHDSIQVRIESIWASADVWPQLLEGMRQVLPPPTELKEDDIRPRVWAPLLPGLCCQAAGGEFEWSLTVAAAWSLFHTAAHLLDHVADQDEPESSGTAWEAGLTINVATGLIISAFRGLNALLSEANASDAAPDLIAGFHKHLFMVAGGQQVDLLVKEPTTKQWWQVAEAKSGAPFALACWAGARLSSEDLSRLEEFRLFGHHLGLIVQMLDDARDFLPQFYSTGDTDKKSLSPWSLPIAYAMEVLPSDRQLDLRRRLSVVGEDPGQRDQILEIVEGSGASLYLETYLEYHREKAISSVLSCAIPGPARERLLPDSRIATQIGIAVRISSPIKDNHTGSI